MGILKTVKVIFGQDKFFEAVNRIVEGRQGRKDVEHKERTEVREQEAKTDVWKEKNKTDKAEHKFNEKSERRDLKDEHGRFPRIKEKRKNKGNESD